MSGTTKPFPGEFNPEDMDPALDIDLETQRSILTLFGQLELLSHYELLGVEPTADKKDIKNAYFARMNQFHVDKFYGKNIGPFGQKLQKIAQQLTRASDVLTRKKSRAEYDEYLSSRNQTLGARDSIPPARKSSIPPSGARSRPSRPAVAPIDFVTIPSSPRAPSPAPSPQARSIPDATPSSSHAAPPPAPTPGGSEPLSPKPDAAGNTGNTGQGSGAKSGNEAARRLLARKMGLSPRPTRSSGPASSAARPAVDSTQARHALDAELKARFDARKNQGQKLATTYQAAAHEARSRGDWGGAVSSIRKALQAAPDDLHLQAEVEAIQEEADRALAPRFVEQAKYEEREGSFDRAARSYERAARGRNSAELFDRAARCLLKQGKLSDEDKRKLVDLARKSVSLDNRQVDYRLTLAKAYDVTGMKTSALGELRRALELDPNNKDAKELQKAFR